MTSANSIKNIPAFTDGSDLVWSDEFHSGSFLLDEQHKRMFDICARLSRLEDVRSTGKSQDLASIMQELIDYIVQHLTTEEEILRIYRFPDYDSHVKEHRLFSSRLEQLSADLRSGDMNVGGSLLYFIRRWLVQHVKSEAEEFRPFFARIDGVL